MSNVLYRTKCYTIGNMEYADGSSWRTKVEEALLPRNITVFNPYNHHFINDVDETPDVRVRMRGAMHREEYDTVAEWSKLIRRFDLNLVDRSDFIIAYVIPNVGSWGTAEELSTAIAARKPIFIIMDGGKKNTPLWLMGQLKHKFIYDTLDQALEMITNIDDGKVVIDNPVWRLLKKEYR